MKDTDFDLDSEDLRLPRQYTSPRQVDSSMLINDSARYFGDAVKKGIDSFNKRLESIETAKNANTEFIVGLQAQASALDNLDDNNVSTQVQDILNAEIDDLSILGYNSIGRDQTEYIKRKSQLLNSTKNLLENLANKDEQASGFKEVFENGQAGNKVSQLTPRVNQEYLKDIILNDGKNSKVEYKDGAFIVSFTSKDNETLTFNASNDINATKKGAAPLIQYVDDFDPSYKTAYDRIVAKYQPRLLQVTNVDENGRTVVTKTKEYNLIRNAIIKELENDPNFAANATVDETQFLRGKGVDGIEEIYKIDLDDKNASLLLNDQIKSQRANYIAGLYLPQDQEISRAESDPAAMTQNQREQLELDKRKLNFQIQQAQNAGSGSDDEEVADEKVRLSFIETKKAIEEFETKKLRNGKTKKELIKEVYDRNLEKAEGDKERVDVALENSDAWKKLTDPMTSTLDPYLNKKVKIGDEDYKITDFTIGVDDDGDFVIIPTYLDMEGKPPERTQSIQYKFNETGIEALNDDLQLAGSDQFTQPDPITLPSNAEYQASLANAKSGDIITKPDGTKVEIFKKDGKIFGKII